MEGQRCETQMTVPSLNSEQCKTETAARRGVLAVLLREPGARQERPR